MSPRGWRRAIKVICVLNETCEGMYGSFMRAGGGTHDFVHLLCTALYWVETSPRASEEAAVGVRVGWYVMGWGVEVLGYRGQRRASRDLCLVLFLFSHHAPKNARARRRARARLLRELRAVERRGVKILSVSSVLNYYLVRASPAHAPGVVRVAHPVQPMALRASRTTGTAK